jgi:hypothetical protein
MVHRETALPEETNLYSTSINFFPLFSNSSIVKRIS